jgi:hypothetical protein
MFAVIAGGIWLLAAFGVRFNGVNMPLLGLSALAFHLAFGGPFWPQWRRRS